MCYRTPRRRKITFFRVVRVFRGLFSDETCTLLQSVLGHSVAYGREVQKGGIGIMQVDEQIPKKAWEIFEQHDDEDFSFTDHTSFVAMRRGKILLVFRFDRHFQQYGFRTVPRNCRERGAREPNC